MTDFYTLSYGEITKMRETFNEKLFQCYEKKRNSCYEWRKRTWIQKAIGVIEAYNKDPHGPWTSGEPIMANLYKVTEENGDKRLRMKRNVNDTFGQQIMPLEDYFDILYKAHIKTAHGSRLKMQEHLTRLEIYMPLRALQMFLRLCKVCELQEKEKKAGNQKKDPAQVLQNYRGFMELFDMRNRPDGEYKFILHYRDLATDYRFLRPLRSSGVIDIAEELLKLFLQIGCPGILHTPIVKSYTYSIIQRLTLAWPGCLILSGKPMKSSKNADGIETRISKWITDNSSNWSTGIYFVANEMNLIKDGKYSKSTPYRNLLGNKPTKGLNTKRMKSLLKDVMYEEDLLKINYVDYGDETSASSDETDDATREESQDKPAPAQTDLDLPGPSSVYQKVAKAMVGRYLDSQEESLRLRQLNRKPMKTYTKKAKPDVSKDSLEIEIELQRDKYPMNKLKTYQRGTNAKPVQTIVKPQISLTQNEATSPRALCIDENLRYICPVQSMNKNMLKRQQLWNTPTIDLPCPLEETGPVKPITVSDEIFFLADNFGAIEKDIIEHPVKIEMIDDDKTNAEVFPAFNDPPDFGKIVKVESLSSDVKSTEDMDL